MGGVRREYAVFRCVTAVFYGLAGGHISKVLYGTKPVFGHSIICIWQKNRRWLKVFNSCLTAAQTAIVRSKGWLAVGGFAEICLRKSEAVAEMGPELIWPPYCLYLHKQPLGVLIWESSRLGRVFCVHGGAAIFI